jgi:TRAP-type mannitol/chloroaromatic compound transport system substrate-binding protein
MSRRGLSPRAALVAVLAAFAAGLLGSLAIRPPVAATTVSPRAESSQVVRLHWRLPVAFGTNLKALGDNVLYVAAALEAATGGAIELVPYEPGEIVPAFSIVDAVRDGKVPAGYTWLGYDQGKIPASALIAAVPFGMEPWEFSAWWYESDGERLTQSLYARYGVHPLFCGIIGPETAGWFRKPIDRAEDLRGLKIRFAGLGGKILERLGASITMLPGGEIFQALEKGAIDATEYSLPVVDEALGFDRVAPINYFPGWHQTYTSFHLVVNLETWLGLTDVDRALLETTCTAGVTRNLARSEGLQGRVIAGYGKRGVDARVIAPELLDVLREVADQVLDAEAAADADFAAILASQRAFRRDYAVWRRIAYLPVDR